MAQPKMTLQVLRVLQVLVDAGEAERYGLELCDETELPSGTIYPIVARLERAGWLESRWEAPGLHAVRKTPPRRYYRLTRDGAELARESLGAAHRRRPRAAAGWGRLVPGAQGAQA
jgi:PadR family transcriptional regulator, regulatory protein PadR